MENPNISTLAFVSVPYEELVELLEARSERDLILATAMANGFSSYRIDDLVRGIATVRGLIPREAKDDA